MPSVLVVIMRRYCLEKYSIFKQTKRNDMKALKITICTFLVLFGLGWTAHLQAQTTKPTIYHPEEDAKASIAKAVEKAKASGKHVFLQLGGNWCVWCIRFHEMVQGNAELKKLMESEYEVLHVNYSPENKNEDVLAALDFPQRFGFPVFVILDENGKRIHTQNSAYLEEGNGHDPKKVEEFFKSWTKKSVTPSTYQTK
jgi:thioredoxin-related protein